MPITPDSPWRHPPRITLAGFERVLRRGNPGILAERPASSYYNVCAAKGVDPLYILAKFNHESSLGTAGTAVSTHSWGNTRKPNFGAVPIREIAGRTGSFPVWRDWLDGLKSTVERLVTPEWIYSERESIREIYDWPPDQTKVWAPAGDLNDPSGYLRAVIDFMNQHEDVVMQAQIPGFLWKPEACGEYGYPQGTHGRNGVAIDRLIIHYTAGTDSADYLITCHGNSAHFLTERDGTPRYQMVRLEDAAWAAGHQDFNLRGVQLEIERTVAESKTWPDALIENVAMIAADICKACPGITPDREHIIGHADVPPPNDHTDPGGFFPWPHFIDRVRFYWGMNAPVPSPNPSIRYFPETGHSIGHGFLEFWSQFSDDATSIRIFGYPLTDELTEDGRTVQYFERAVFEYWPENPTEYTVLLRRLGADALEAA